MRNAMVFLLLAVILGACAAPASPTPIPTTVPPTETSSPLPAGTQSLTPAVIASVAPTMSPTATRTPEPTITFTPIILFYLPSITPTPAHTFDCSLVNQSIANGDEMDPGERFSIGWQVVNTGAASWYPGTVLFTYIGGTKMYLYPTVQLKDAVQPGEMTALTVDMKAPKNSTKYSTFWGLRQGDTVFCRVGLTIYVK